PNDENFNLKPKGPSIPDDQRKIAHDVYETANILKLFKARGEFGNDPASFTEFITRVLQAAVAGCCTDNVDTKLAADAIEQIRADIMERKGKTIVYRYLSSLAFWALPGIVVGIALIL